MRPICVGRDADAAVAAVAAIAAVAAWRTLCARFDSEREIAPI